MIDYWLFTAFGLGILAGMSLQWRRDKVRVERLEAENDRLKAENDELNETLLNRMFDEGDLDTLRLTNTELTEVAKRWKARAIGLGYVPYEKPTQEGL